VEPHYNAGACVANWRNTQTPEREADALVGAAHSHGVKALIGVSGIDAMPDAQKCISPENFGAFARHIAAFVAAHGYDGVDFAWDPSVSPRDYGDAILTLRSALPNAIITVPVDVSGLAAVGPVQQYVDQINVAIPGLTAFGHRPLAEGDADYGAGLELLTENVTVAGIEPAKVGIALPMYGNAAETCVTSDESENGWDSPSHRGECVAYGMIRAVAATLRISGFGGIMACNLTAEYRPGESGDARYPLSAAMLSALSGEFHDNASSTRIAAQAAPTPRYGVNLSGAEYSWGTFASEKDIAYLKGRGIKIVRVPIAWERIQPSLYRPLSTTYLKGLVSLLRTAAAYGVDVIVDLHNYGRYNPAWANSGNIGPGQGNVIGSAALPIRAYADLWGRVATALKGTPGLAYYDIMNEPHGMGDASVWPSAIQAAVNAIRAADSKTTILVEGTGYASARWWAVNNRNLHIADPANKLLYEAHLYFDEDGSATYPVSYTEQGAYTNLGVDRVQPFLTWLQQNGARGFLGEFGVPGGDSRWLTVLDNFLATLQKAGISGTYWTYQYHSATDPAWWPSFETMGIYPAKNQDAAQLNVIANRDPK
jgi:endoglucanase